MYVDYLDTYPAGRVAQKSLSVDPDFLVRKPKEVDGVDGSNE